MRTRIGKRPRKRHLILAALLGAAAAVVPAVASSETAPTVNAVEESHSGLYGPETRFRWSPSQVEIAANGAVNFANSSTTVTHGVQWTGGPETPSCSGVPINEGKPDWKGTCTLMQPGTYTFRCIVHPTEMTGTIVVHANGTVTTTTPNSPPPPTTTTTTTPQPSPESPLAGSASRALILAKNQRGGSVRGSIDISRAGAGGRLDVDLFAQRTQLAKAKHSSRVHVGHLVRSSLHAGRVSFAVSLDRRARRALRRHHRLALVVKVVLAPVHGQPLTIARAVVEHA